MTSLHSQLPSCLTAIVPVFNEGQFIDDLLKSLQGQHTQGFDLEILVIDGMSQDDTRQRVLAIAAEDPRIKLLSNPARHTPAALNIGLRAAGGEYVSIMGAHAEYDPDYISVCLRELLAHEAVACSGKVVTTPANSSLQARLVAWTAAHPFASSSRSVRTQPEGYADTVPFPVARKRALLDLGGYNERLVRNQDNDMNQRLRAAGFKLYVTGQTTCRYYARPDIKSFLKYAFLNGFWNALSLKENSSSLGLRHLAPLFFVIALLVLLGLAIAGLALHEQHSQFPALAAAAIVITHLTVGATSGVQSALRQKTAAALWIAPLTLAFHCSYGLGTLRGLVLPAGFSKKGQLQKLPESSKDAA